MEYKTVFRHIQNSASEIYRNYNGMTVAMTKDPTTPGNYLVSVALCSTKDQYCRKTGREVALNKVPESLPLKDIPNYIANYHVRVYFQPSVQGFKYFLDQWKVFCFKFI